ncbi:hypothetical protein Clacol_004218 [Clathrus columnatus]|uniref:Uncharacterized protein n=1 Tax=Clathrus columnatus TaxID=1419009 RepID=A0AAV5A5W1_9AGAM|nr:hypothetical protein Clacol_004218 [Clathrus columnatus]
MNPPQNPRFIYYEVSTPPPPTPSINERNVNLVPPYIHNLPPTPPGNPGKSILYLPHRLFVGPDALSANFHPSVIPNIYPSNFPLPRISGLLPTDITVPLTSKLIPLKESAYTTQPNAHTETAIEINALANSDQTKLKTVKACTSFWENVCAYAGHETCVNPPGLPPLNTWTSDRRIPVPTAEEQAMGVKALAGWYLWHFNRPATMPSMTSEPSVQREVAIQMTEPLNALLKTRYTPLKPPRGNLTEYSGIPQTKVGAVADNGKFLWSSTEVSAKLIRQLWGQLHFFGCRLGFVTNGSMVMLVARTNPNTLILSVPKKWTDNTVLTALAGLSFAGVDMAYLNEEGSSQLLNTYLCPEAHRKAAWPEASQGQQGGRQGQ